jgi:hypothetical protein
VFADGESTSTISVTIVNDDGSFDGGSLTVDVNNVAPVAVIAGDATVQEGETYTLTLGDIFDPGTDTITSATITWGDGSETEYTGAGDYTHVFSDGDANFTIELNVTDEDGDFVAASTKSLSIGAMVRLLKLLATLAPSSTYLPMATTT